MNWGYRIALLYIGFVAFMLTLVFFSYSISVDLVAKDYYRQELAYQKQIDKMENVLKLGKRPTLKVEATEALIRLQMPTGHESVEGEVLFFRPDSPKLDFKVPLMPTKDGAQVLPIGNLKKGLWRLKLTWKHTNKEFYFEEKVKI
jgi:hypothetical protein